MFHSGAGHTLCHDNPTLGQHWWSSRLHYSRILLVVFLTWIWSWFSPSSHNWFIFPRCPVLLLTLHSCSWIKSDSLIFCSGFLSQLCRTLPWSYRYKNTTTLRDTQGSWLFTHKIRYFLQVWWHLLNRNTDKLCSSVVLKWGTFQLKDKEVDVMGASIDQSVFIGKVNKNFPSLLPPKQIQIQIKIWRWLGGGSGAHL